MKIEESEKIGKLYFEEMWSKPDLTIANEIIDPNYNPSWIQIDKQGPEQMKHEITYFRSMFPDLKYEIVELKGEEDKVWVRYKGHGTNLGKGWGFEPTNKKVSFEGATILYFNTKGKIIDRWGAFCFYDILYDLGVVPPFWELHKYFSGI
ncbi:MAG: ester cyclase [Candidatus Hodarchaeota archaeon]